VAITIMAIGRGSSLSKRLRYLHSTNTKNGHVDVQKTLNPKGVRDFRVKAQANLQAKVAGELRCFKNLTTTNEPAAMNEEDRIAYDAARDIPEVEEDGYVTEDEPMHINDVLDGTTDLNLSHAGGEFHQIMEEELHKQNPYVSPLAPLAH
jgi:hypothetical protein